MNQMHEEKTNDGTSIGGNVNSGGDFTGRDSISNSSINNIFDGSLKNIIILSLVIIALVSVIAIVSIVINNTGNVPPDEISTARNGDVGGDINNAGGDINNAGGDINIDSNPKFSISGRFFKGEEPISGLELDLFDKAAKLDSTKTKKDGKFEFTDLTPGEYFIDFSEDAGLGIIPISLSNIEPSVNLPVQVDDLVEISFLFSDYANQVLFIDGREVTLVSGGAIIGGDDGHILSGHGTLIGGDGNDIITVGEQFKSTFLLTPDIHTFEYHTIELDSKEPPIRYKKLDLIESQTRKFVADEDIYLKHLEILDVKLYHRPAFPAILNENSYLEFIVEADTHGFKSENVVTKLDFPELFLGENIFEVSTVIDERIQRIRIPLPVPLDTFSPFNTSLNLGLRIYSSEDNLLDIFLQNHLFFHESDNSITALMIDMNEKTIDQVRDNLVWSFENIEFEEDFSTQNDDLWLIGSDEIWTGEISDERYLLSNEIKSRAVRYQWVGLKNISLENYPVSVLVNGNYNGSFSSSGLIYRFDDEKNHYYAYTLGPNGQAIFYLRDSNGFRDIFSKNPSNLNETGLNELSIIGDDSLIYLYVNRLLLDIIEDDTVYGNETGIISLDIGEYIFDDFTIYANQ